MERALLGWRQTRMARSLGTVLVVALLLTVVVLPMGTAHACECDWPSGPGAPLVQVAEAEAAVVGTVRRVQRPLLGRGGLATVTLDVELSIHQDLGASTSVPVDVDTSCGIDAQPGDRVGWLLLEGVERSGVGLCSAFGAEELLDATALPSPTATGPPAFLATGALALAPFVELDRDGQVVGYGTWDEPPPLPLPGDGSQQSTVRIADVCADGRVVEYVGERAWGGGPTPRIVVRDTTSGEVVSSTTYSALLDGAAASGPNVFGGASCLDDGDVLAVLSSYNPPEQTDRRVVRIGGDGFSTIAEGAFHEVHPVGDRALTRVGGGSRLAWLDLASGAVDEVMELPAETTSMALAPDRSAVWLIAGAQGSETDEARPYRLLRIDPAGPGVTGEVTLDAADVPPFLLPASDRVVWLVLSGRDHFDYRRYDGDLRLVERLADRPLQGLVEHDGRLVGVDQEGQVWARHGEGERFKPLGEPSGLPLDRVVALPGVVEPLSNRHVPAFTTYLPWASPPPDTPGARLDDMVTPSAGMGGGGVGLANTATALLIALGLVVWFRLRYGRGGEHQDPETDRRTP